jgi:MoaA/NifB/PqqE/SkfB family radical SAM enzyme
MHFAFEVNRVNIRFTFPYNIACTHCYNRSGSRGRAHRIELERMLGIIEQMPRAHVPALNLIAGEPFLYRDKPMTLIAAGRAARLEEISALHQLRAR